MASGVRRPARGENRLEPISKPELVWSCPRERREVMTVAVRRRSAREETARRGEEIYERDIEPTLAEDQHGRVVAIDVDSGDWAIADEVLQAAADLRVQRPEANDVWLLRVGYRALHSFGGQRLRSPT